MQAHVNMPPTRLLSIACDSVNIHVLNYAALDHDI